MVRPLGGRFGIGRALTKPRIGGSIICGPRLGWLGVASLLGGIASCQPEPTERVTQTAPSTLTTPHARLAADAGAAAPSGRELPPPHDAQGALVAAARTFLAMGAVPVRLRAWAPGQAPLDRALPRAQLLVEALEATFSTHRPGSALSRLNARGTEPSRLTDGHLLALLDDAVRWAELTDSAFDPTVGPLVALWRRAESEDRWPTADALGAARSHVGRRHLRLDPRARTVALDPGTEVDLNAIAEGYMIDRVVDLLRAEGVLRAYVEVGGDLRVYDDTPEPRPFRIGVRRPGRDGLVGTVELERGALGSAGCYERFFVLQGERLCHVIDPRSGQPVRGTEGATVLAPTATAADALATALLVLGPEWALSRWGQSEDFGAVVVTRGSDGRERTYVTAAMGPSSR